MGDYKIKEKLVKSIMIYASKENFLKDVGSNMEYRKYMKKAEFEKALNSLVGIIEGIRADEHIDKGEIEELQHWCLLQHHQKSRYPFKEIIPLIKLAIEDSILTSDEIEDILWSCKTYLNQSPYFDVITKDIQVLHGIMHGIMSDNHISEKELKHLKDWLDTNSHLETVYPYDEIYTLVFNVLRDGKVDHDEEMMLKLFFSEFIDTTVSLNINKGEFEQLKETLNINGLCALAPDIEFFERSFCLTGESRIMKRSEIGKIIIENGGILHNNVKNDTSYLVVGDNSNPCWAFSCYGRKVEKAMNLRKKGKNIIIVHEVDFWDALA